MLNTFLSDSWSFFKIHAVALSMIILPIVVPVEILTAVYAHLFTSEELVLSEHVIPMGIGFAVHPIYAIAVVFYIASVISDKRLDGKNLWALGAKFWYPFIVLELLVGAVVFFGLILLIVPGVIFAIRYAFAEFELLLKQREPIDAMRTSWHATLPYVPVILAGYCVITAVLFVPYYFAISIFREPGIALLVFETAANTAYAVLGSLYTIFAFRVYEFANSTESETTV